MVTIILIPERWQQQHLALWIHVCIKSYIGSRLEWRAFVPSSRNFLTRNNGATHSHCARVAEVLWLWWGTVGFSLANDTFDRQRHQVIPEVTSIDSNGHHCVCPYSYTPIVNYTLWTAVWQLSIHFAIDGWLLYIFYVSIFRRYRYWYNDFSNWISRDNWRSWNI